MYNDLMNKQVELRERFSKIYRNNPQDMIIIATEMGISNVSITKFFKGKDLDYKRLCLMEDWIIKKEKVHPKTSPDTLIKISKILEEDYGN